MTASGRIFEDPKVKRKPAILLVRYFICYWRKTPHTKWLPTSTRTTFKVALSHFPHKNRHNRRSSVWGYLLIRNRPDVFPREVQKWKAPVIGISANATCVVCFKITTIVNRLQNPTLPLACTALADVTSSMITGPLQMRGCHFSRKTLVTCLASPTVTSCIRMCWSMKYNTRSHARRLKSSLPGQPNAFAGCPP